MAHGVALLLLALCSSEAVVAASAPPAPPQPEISSAYVQTVGCQPLSLPNIAFDPSDCASASKTTCRVVCRYGPKVNVFGRRLTSNLVSMCNKCLKHRQIGTVLLQAVDDKFTTLVTLTHTQVFSNVCGQSPPHDHFGAVYCREIAGTPQIRAHQQEYCALRKVFIAHRAVLCM